MAGSSSYDNSAPVANINVTPFVDVMLVLLIIFMVTTPMMQQGVDVNLPKASTAPIAGSADEQVVLSVDRGGGIFIGKGNPVGLADLPKKISAVMSVRGAADRKVFIRADTDLVYGRIMEVMGKLHEGGIEQIGLISAPVDADRVRAAKEQKNKP